MSGPPLADWDDDRYVSFDSNDDCGVFWNSMLVVLSESTSSNWNTSLLWMSDSLAIFLFELFVVIVIDVGECGIAGGGGV